MSGPIPGGQGGYKYESPASQALSTITPESYVKAYADQTQFISKLVNDVSFMASSMRVMQRGIDKANENPVQQIQAMLADVLVLLGGHGDTGFDFGDLKYVIMAWGSLLGLSDENGNLILPVDLIGGLIRFFTNYIAPGGDFKDAVDALVDSIIATMLDVFGEVPILGQAAEQFAVILSDWRDMFDPIISAVEAFMGAFSLSAGVGGAAGITAFWTPLKPVLQTFTTLLYDIGAHLPDISIPFTIATEWSMPFIDALAEFIYTLAAVVEFFTHGQAASDLKIIFTDISALFGHPGIGTGSFTFPAIEDIPILGPIVIWVKSFITAITGLTDPVVDAVEDWATSLNDGIDNAAADATQALTDLADIALELFGEAGHDVADFIQWLKDIATILGHPTGLGGGSPAAAVDIGDIPILGPVVELGETIGTDMGAIRDAIFNAFNNLSDVGKSATEVEDAIKNFFTDLYNKFTGGSSVSASHTEVTAAVENQQASVAGTATTVSITETVVQGIVNGGLSYTHYFSHDSDGGMPSDFTMYTGGSFEVVNGYLVADPGSGCVLNTPTKTNNQSISATWTDPGDYWFYARMNTANNDYIMLTTVGGGIGWTLNPYVGGVPVDITPPFCNIDQISNPTFTFEPGTDDNPYLYRLYRNNLRILEWEDTDHLYPVDSDHRQVGFGMFSSKMLSFSAHDTSFVTGSIPYDLSLMSVAATTARAVGYGDNPMGIKLQRDATLKSVTFRGRTADVSGNLVAELRKNGAQISGTSTTVAAANQVAGVTSTGAWYCNAGDIITAYVTAVGSTPGQGLVADITGIAGIAV